MTCVPGKSNRVFPSNRQRTLKRSGPRCASTHATLDQPGIRPRFQARPLRIRPDLALERLKIAILVDWRPQRRFVSAPSAPVTECSGVGTLPNMPDDEAAPYNLDSKTGTGVIQLSELDLFHGVTWTRVAGTRKWAGA